MKDPLATEMRPPVLPAGDDRTGRHDVPLKAAALQFPMAHPAVATVIPGARTAAEAEENARMFSHGIPTAFWKDLRAEGLLPEEAPVPDSPV